MRRARFAWPDVVSLALLLAFGSTPGYWALWLLLAWLALCGAWRELWDATAGREEAQRAEAIEATAARLAELERSQITT